MAGKREKLDYYDCYVKMFKLNKILEDRVRVLAQSKKCIVSKIKQVNTCIIRRKKMNSGKKKRGEKENSCLDKMETLLEIIT